MVFWHPYYIKNIEKCEYCLSSFYKPILFDMVYIEYNGFALTCVHSSLFFLCHVFCFICLHTVSCVRCLCLWIVLSLCLVYVACVSGLSCLCVLCTLLVSQDCPVFITPAVYLDLWCHLIFFNIRSVMLDFINF